MTDLVEVHVVLEEAVRAARPRLEQVLLAVSAVPAQIDVLQKIKFTVHTYIAFSTNIEYFSICRVCKYVYKYTASKYMLILSIFIEQVLDTVSAVPAQVDVLVHTHF